MFCNGTPACFGIAHQIGCNTVVAVSIVDSHSGSCSQKTPSCNQCERTCLRRGTPVSFFFAFGGVHMNFACSSMAFFKYWWKENNRYTARTSPKLISI